MEFRTLEDLPRDGEIMRNPRTGLCEALVPPGPYATAHAPCLLELSDGSMLCAWFAGSFEGSTDVSIVCARLPAGQARWTEPSPISSDPERSEQNPSLFAAPNGAVWAVYTAQKARQEGKDNMQFTSQVRVQESHDGGLTWGPYWTLFPKEGTFCRQPIQVLSNGRWIMGNWICTDSPDGLFGDPTVFKISDDAGKTWREVEMPQSCGRVHANVVELESGELAAFMRSREADFIYVSRSYDFGDTWSAPVPTELPNNNSGISAIRLDDGRIAIACNPTCASHPVKGKAAWPGLRCPVAVAISEDGGRSFPLMRIIEAGEGFVGAENRTNNAQYEYPYLMQSRDGALHLAFAFHNRECVKYMRFTKEQIAGKRRENEGRYNPTSAKVS